MGTALAAAFWLLPAPPIVAQGTIFYYRPAEPLNYAGVPVPPYNYREIDINQDGTTDFAISADPAFVTITMFGENRVASIPATPPDLGSSVFPFAAGTEIGSSLTPVWSWESANDLLGSSSFSACFNVGCIGTWVGVNAYVGVEITAGLSKHYGWIHLYNGAFSAGEIYDWAYNTVPGQPILAGQVPEPGTWFLVTLGSLWLWHCRRVKP
jgi:hypothetical protein